jgi:hypothetical protein
MKRPTLMERAYCGNAADARDSDCHQTPAQLWNQARQSDDVCLGFCVVIDRRLPGLLFSSPSR